MTRPDFLRRITDILDDAERTEMFGAIEIEIRAGRPVVMHTTTTDKLETYTGENNRGRQNYR